MAKSIPFAKHELPPFERQSARGQSDARRITGRDSCRDRIGVEEIILAGKCKRPSERTLATAVRACNYREDWQRLRRRRRYLADDFVVLFAWRVWNITNLKSTAIGVFHYLELSLRIAVEYRDSSRQRIQARSITCGRCPRGEFVAEDVYHASMILRCGG